jgi:hypothetical protein
MFSNKQLEQFLERGAPAYSFMVPLLLTNMFSTDMAFDFFIGKDPTKKEMIRLRPWSMDTIYHYQNHTLGPCVLSLTPQTPFVPHLGGWIQNRDNRKILDKYHPYLFKAQGLKIHWNNLPKTITIHYKGPAIPGYADFGLEFFLICTQPLRNLQSKRSRDGTALKYRKDLD